MPLARAGLGALQAWNTQLPSSVVDPYFRGILPALDDYLKTKGVEGLCVCACACARVCVHVCACACVDVAIKPVMYIWWPIRAHSFHGYVVSNTIEGSHQ